MIKTPYSQWAEGQIQRIKDVLDNARNSHTQAVKDRISSVEQMKDVVSLTQGLFALSKVRILSQNLVDESVDMTTLTGNCKA